MTPWPNHEGKKPEDLVAEVLHLRGQNRGLETKLCLVTKQLNAMPPWEAIPPTQREMQLANKATCLEGVIRDMENRGIERERHVQWLQGVVSRYVQRQDIDNAGGE